MKRRKDIIMDNALRNVKNYKANESKDSSIKNDMVENLSLNSSSFIENSPQCTQTDNINIFTLTHSIETESILFVITSHINVDGASTSQLATRSGRAISKSNYFASPINGPESDPDLSDDDPIFQDPKDICRHRSLSSSSTDSKPETLENDTQQPQPRKSRKRQRNPASWKQNITKGLRNKGKPYKSLSKSKKEVPARCMKNACAPCRLKCPDQINESQRTAIF
ncbi:unnamed protein product [Arctia plantaginis]|nr:unnamed protein product [Arctia plantaginis]